MTEPHKIFFAPQLYIQSGITDISFYESAFGAVELRRFTNDDDSIHVAELSIAGALFHLHEESPHSGRLAPGGISGTTVLLGLFVTDVDQVMKQAVQAGAVVISAAHSYDYGYRQAEIRDPFGHTWMIEMEI